MEDFSSSLSSVFPSPPPSPLPLATLPRFLSKELSIEERESVLKKSIKLAVEVCDKSWDAKKRISEHSCNRALVAASTGSYGAYLANGSYLVIKVPHVDLDKLKDFRRCKLQVLVEVCLDLIAFETIPNKLEAQADVLQWLRLQLNYLIRESRGKTS
ncbi:hypothetical protein ACSBR1_005379 [Camellia fascicularis]